MLGDAYEATRYRSSLLHQIRNTYTQIHSGLTTKKWGQNIFVSLFFSLNRTVTKKLPNVSRSFLLSNIWCSVFGFQSPADPMKIEQNSSQYKN